ncbi:MAG: M81 family metallopeptidase, partial [Hyphomicrobiales bacterium]|nr:M81 family metallopeptidase [Hyphomicrobiales bacterium]
MKLFIGGLCNESNSFSPIATTEASFRNGVWHDGDATRYPASHVTAPLINWRRAAERQGIEVIEGFFSAAEPGGPLPREDYERLRDRLLEDLTRAIPVDLVLFNLHGSMIAEGYDDCEGDLIGRAREIVGRETIIGAELDLHCSITSEMIKAADILVTYKEYPHTDAQARADELFALAVAAARREIAPVMVTAECCIVGAWWTRDEPTKSFVARMSALEGRDNILSVSFAHGFPWADVPEGAAKMLVVADGDLAAAKALADRLAGEVWAMREEAQPK